MKKLLTFILLIAIVFPMTLVASAQQKPLGDVNLNGAVEKYDYILVKRAVLGTVTLDDEQSANADANENGKVEKYDYILIKRHV
ncbi:MAG: dockerin type I repeat-containing protein, partial [Clostridia bacterium]|nr:dockerin type I repeat-containing protein [Clostridia bacterium]